MLSVAFSPDGGLLAIGLANSENDNSVKLWDVITHDRKATIQQELWSFDTKSKHDVAFSPDGRLFAATGGGNAVIRVWRTEPSTSIPLSLRRGTLIESSNTNLQWQGGRRCYLLQLEVRD